MENNELFHAWMNLTKYHNRILKAIDYTLHEHFQMGMKEFYLLHSLRQAEQKKMKLSDLVPKVGLSHSALSRLVTRLEKHRDGSLVERQMDKEDKRSVAIVLMEKGERLASEMQIIINKSLQARMVGKDIINIKRLVE